MNEKLKYFLFIFGILFVIYCTSETIEKFADGDSVSDYFEEEMSDDNDDDVMSDDNDDDVMSDDVIDEIDEMGEMDEMDEMDDDTIDNEIDDDASDNEIDNDNRETEKSVMVEADVINNTDVIEDVLNEFDSDDDNLIDKSELKNLIDSVNVEGFSNSNDYAKF